MTLPDWLAGPLAFRMADYDAEDTYLFTPRALPGGLRVHYRSTGGDGTLEMSAATLESAQRWSRVSQGGSSHDAGTLADFLLPRDIFRQLKATQVASWSMLWGSDTQLELEGAGACTISVGGAPRSFPCLKLSTSDAVLWVIDDDTWPVVVWQTALDNFWKVIGFAVDRPLGAVRRWSTIAEPVLTQPVPGPADGEAAIHVLAAPASTRLQLARAAEKLETLHDDASREALFALLRDPSRGHWAVRPLRARVAEAGFADALYAVLRADLSDGSEPAQRRLTTLLSGLRFAEARAALAAHEPLLELLRKLALDRTSRAAGPARGLLIALEDEPFRREVLRLAEDPRTIGGSPELVALVVDYHRERSQVPELGARLLPLWAAIEDETWRYNALLQFLQTGVTSEWLPVLAHWQQHLAGEAVQRMLALEALQLASDSGWPGDVGARVLHGELGWLAGVKADAPVKLGSDGLWVKLVRWLCGSGIRYVNGKPAASGSTTWAAVADLGRPEVLEPLLGLYRELQRLDRVTDRRGLPNAQELAAVLGQATSPAALARFAAFAAEDRLPDGSVAFGPIHYAVNRRPPESVLPHALEVVRQSTQPAELLTMQRALPLYFDKGWRPLADLLVERLTPLAAQDPSLSYAATMLQLPRSLAEVTFDESQPNEGLTKKEIAAALRAASAPFTPAELEKLVADAKALKLPKLGATAVKSIRNPLARGLPAEVEELYLRHDGGVFRNGERRLELLRLSELRASVLAHPVLAYMPGPLLPIARDGRGGLYVARLNPPSMFCDVIWCHERDLKATWDKDRNTWRYSAGLNVAATFAARTIAGPPA